MPHCDWTSAWIDADGLALSSWTRDGAALADLETRRLLELALELVVRRERLVLHGYVVLPGALHLVTGVAASGGLPWTLALGRVKACHARWSKSAGWRGRSAWKDSVRVQPLAASQLRDAVERLHRAPVSVGLAESPADWPTSSWRTLYESTRGGFVVPADARGSRPSATASARRTPSRP